MSNRPYLDQMEVDGVTYDLRAANGTPLIEGYGGNDLSEEFASAEALHTAIAAGDFSKIHIGDYFPVTLNGSYKDYARFTVPSGTTYYTDAALTTEGGTTEADAEGEYQSATAIKFKVSGTDVYASISDCTAGFTKSMNANVKLEVAAINPYLRHGDTELTAQHILLCSRDCLPPTLQYRCNNSVWFDTTQVNPWRGSALWETLNNADDGIIKLLEATSLGAYVFKGPNNKGMRAMLATMAAGAGSPTNWAWTDRGRLFLPTEREVYGAPRGATQEAMKRATCITSGPSSPEAPATLSKEPETAAAVATGGWRPPPRPRTSRVSAATGLPTTTPRPTPVSACRSASSSPDTLYSAPLWGALKELTDHE